MFHHILFLLILLILKEPAAEVPPFLALTEHLGYLIFIVATGTHVCQETKVPADHIAQSHRLEMS